MGGLAVKAKIVLRGRTLLVLFMLTGGCATQAQRQFQQMQEQGVATFRIVSACKAQVDATDVGRRIKQIFIVDENDPLAIEKMLINRISSESENKDIIDYRTMFQPCRTQAIEGFGKVHPLFVNLFAKWYSENDEMLLKIIKGEITVGDANAFTNKVSPLRTQAFTEADKEITQNLQNSHNFELQQRAAAAAALQQWSYQQQLLQQNQRIMNSLNRPTFSNCQLIGNNVSCTSY